MKEHDVFMEEQRNPNQDEIEKYRHERERESEGGRKGGKVGGKRSHGGGRKPSI